MKKRRNLGAIMIMLMVTLIVYLSPEAFAQSSIKLIINQKQVVANPEPFIQNDRTLVPIRVVSENLGATVLWDESKQKVTISKEEKSIILSIGSYLVQITEDTKTTYSVLDVAPIIKEDRTFVPIRLVSNAIGVGIDWDDANRTVLIDSSQKSKVEPFFDLKISSIKSGQEINGTTSLASTGSRINNFEEIRYLLLNLDTKKGFIIAKGNDIKSVLRFTPEMEDNGDKILVAAAYDKEGKFLAGDAMPVKVNIVPDIKLLGVMEGETVTADKVPLGVSLNFTPVYVRYEMINPDNGAYYISPNIDYAGTFNMIPEVVDNGNMKIRVIAYDASGKSYNSEYVNIRINVPKRMLFAGVKENSTISGNVVLYITRNFDVTNTEYVMVDRDTGVETILYSVEYGDFSWFPGPEYAGRKTLYVRVTDTRGYRHTSNSIHVTISDAPKLLLQGVGPEQVVTSSLSLRVKTNVNIENIQYVLKNLSTGEVRTIVSSNGNDAQPFEPQKNETGSFSLKAEATYNGTKISSEEVKFSIYNGQTFSAMPIIEKSKFIEFASNLAKKSSEATGMSAALQTAQSILESAWGQSVPVDKYDGKLSYNLFGYKGEGTAGSVISNTWEEYNGVTFRIDDKFRAYNNVSESWKDYNELLLTRPRYQPFKDVMYNSSLAAWELRRCGYATDSQYAIKLINLIRNYDLKKLDETGI